VVPKLKVVPIITPFLYTLLLAPLNSKYHTKAVPTHGENIVKPAEPAASYLVPDANHN